MKTYKPPFGKLSVNSMQIWLKYDKDRSKKLEGGEVLRMVEEICGLTPSNELKKNIFRVLGLSGNEWDFKTYQQVMGKKGNEKTFYDLVWKADQPVVRKRSTPKKKTTIGFGLSIDVKESNKEASETEEIIDFGMSPRAGRKNFSPPTTNLSKNTLKMWLKYDKSRMKKMHQQQILAMLTDIMGSPPSKRTYAKIMDTWGVIRNDLSWEQFHNLFGQNSNEAQVYADVYRIQYGFMEFEEKTGFPVVACEGIGGGAGDGPNTRALDARLKGMSDGTDVKSLVRGAINDTM